MPGSPEWIHHGHQHLQRYAFSAPYIRHQHVLDLACGAGYGSYVMRGLGAAHVTGIDRDAETIASARSRYARDGVTFTTGDALTCALGTAFDVIVSFETIEHLSDPQMFVENAARHLKPDGRWLVSAPNTLQYQRGNPPVPNPYHLNEPDYATLRSWLEPRFEILEEWEQSPVAREVREPSLQVQIAELQRQGVIRLGAIVERLVRRLARRALPRLSPPSLPRGAMIAATEIMPLLPERRAVCDVFLFVCRPL